MQFSGGGIYLVGDNFLRMDFKIHSFFIFFSTDKYNLWKIFMKRYIIVIPCKLKTNTKIIKIPLFYTESVLYNFSAKDNDMCKTLHINKLQVLGYNKSFDIHNALAFKTKKHAKIYCEYFEFAIGVKYYIKPYWGATTRDNKKAIDKLNKYWNYENIDKKIEQYKNEAVYIDKNDKQFPVEIKMEV